MARGAQGRTLVRSRPNGKKVPQKQPPTPAGPPPVKTFDLEILVGDGWMSTLDAICERRLADGWIKDGIFHSGNSYHFLWRRITS